MRRLLAATFAAFLLMAMFAACSKSGPPPLTLEEIPPAITKAFQSARLQVKKNADAIAQQVKGKQYIPVSIQLQALLSNPDLTREQRNVLSAAMVTINQILQAQAASLQPADAQAVETSGGPKPPVQQVTVEEAAAAAAAVEHYRATK